MSGRLALGKVTDSLTHSSRRAGGTTHLYTIGHSTRTLNELLELLEEYEIRILADVRVWPSSQRYPHFNRDNLQQVLPQNGIEYRWLGAELGGYRKKGLADRSPNKAWKSNSFRNYADYTLTQEFKIAIQTLLGLAENGRVCFMCAERLYWRCHRRIISDYLKVTGHQITHIEDRHSTKEHELPGIARIVVGELRYPA